MTVRAVAKNAEGEISEEANAVYFIGTMEEHIQGLAESCKASGQPLAVISLSMDYDDLFASDKGIYVKGDVFAKSVEGYYRTANKADPEVCLMSLVCDSFQNLAILMASMAHSSPLLPRRPPLRSLACCRSSVVSSP